jgi:tetratricopeptide (TPR) repeat protein
LPCLKCGGSSEGDALLCDGCADTCFKEPKFFLNPTLVGPSVFSRMRANGSLAAVIGPTPGPGYVRLPSTDLQKLVKDASVDSMRLEEAKAFCERCNTILAHLGVKIALDHNSMMLSEDSAETISAIVQKVESIEKMHPLEAQSDLYLRLGVVYWWSSRGILLRTTSKKWKDAKKAILLQRAKEYFSKVGPKDDLRSIAVRNLGMLSYEAGEAREAEGYLTEALRSFPDDTRVGESLAQTMLQMGNTMDALGMVDETITQGETAPLWVLKGKILRNLGRSEEALECFNRSLSLDFKNKEAHDQIIELLREIGRAEEASVAERQRSVSKNPDVEEKVAGLLEELKAAVPETAPAPVHHAHGPHEHPHKDVEPETAPVPPIERAKAAMVAKDFDTVAQLAEEMLRVTPEYKQVQLMLIEALVAKKETSAASHQIHVFYEKNRDDPVAWYWRGKVADLEGKWGAAVQYLSKAVTLDPKLAPAWIAMGDILIANNKLSGADESYSKALQVDGEEPRAWLGKAKTMRGLGRWGAAVQCLDKYTALVPDDREAWLIKSDILFEKEKYRRAADSYSKYLELVPDDSHAICRKGISLNSLGQADEAVQLLEEAVRLDPSNKEAAKWLKSIRTGGGA